MFGAVLICIFNNRQATQYLSRICFFTLFVIGQFNVFSQNPCEIPGYTFGGNYDGHSYYVSDANATSWIEARTLAISIGGHLATVSSAGENAFVTGVAALSIDPGESCHGVWIGLTDEDVEGTFVWVTGEPLIYTNWVPGYPNGSGSGDYTEIIPLAPFNGTWRDIPIWVNYHEFAVEFETVICDCNDPLYAGYDNSITVCNDTLPFDLTEALGGNSDLGGTWTPTLASGGNIYDPVIDGSGSFTYTVSSSDCPSDAASVIVTVLVTTTPIISGVPSNFCEFDNPLTLPTPQDSITGIWSGTGVTNNSFNPSGLNGIYTLIFTPDMGQCGLPAMADIWVEPSIIISVTGIPDSLCQNNPPIPLTTTQSGINGIWVGSGVLNNTFNPAGLNGNIVLTFIPDAGICALQASTTIFVFQNLYNISGIPQSVCMTDLPIQLPNVQNGITGNWSGPGVTSNTFNPNGQNGIVTLTFTPDAGQCATAQSQNILVNALIVPSITGIPNSLCENSFPMTLLSVQNNITGNWSGQGVTSNTFNPDSLNGNIILTFTPDAGQCALSNTTIIQVNTPLLPMIYGIPTSMCESDLVQDLPTAQSGIDGNWSGPGVFNNTFNPSGQNGTIALIFTPIAGQCAQTVEWDITIDALALPIISELPDVVCQIDLPINLPTFQSGYTGMWSGPGVTNNTFDPSGWSGPITIYFNPNDGQCAEVAEAVIWVESAIIPILSGVPNMLCESNSPINLPTTQNGINGNWSGPGVSLNIFNPNGQNGNVMLTFAPDSGQCAIPDTAIISISTTLIPIITGVPASLCQSDSMLLLPELQSGITGIWSGPNVNANSFSPSGLDGNYTLTFSPASGQCADTATIQIVVVTPPSFINLIAACDTIGESYTVSFEITGGDSSTYMVNGMPVNGTIFTSSPFLADSSNYAFTLDDANGCGSVDIQGSINCAC
ncbi:MAG TPA: C-type lectin domain-containing protein, partial [Saprospiraceae bacterium]|nr:C-type lectin domain-containing protein [Saprospiraceae bacterium]